MPEDEKLYEFACTSHSTNKLSLTTAKPKAKIENYNSWNKAFRVLTEIVLLCDPAQCLPMVKYTAELNDNIGKFTFLVTYQYDMNFCLKKQIKPSTPWNVNDNHLWSKCFSGAAKDTSYHPDQQGGSNFHFQRTCDDFNYWSCTRGKCKFQHKCSKCFRTGHSQCQYQLRKSQPVQYFIHNFKSEPSSWSLQSSVRCLPNFYKIIPIEVKLTMS